jgi:hypothetical protein
VLFPGILEFLVRQHGKGPRQPSPRRVKQDRLVDIAQFGGHERPQEARLGATAIFFRLFMSARKMILAYGPEVTAQFLLLDKPFAPPALYALYCNRVIGRG